MSPFFIIFLLIFYPFSIFSIIFNYIIIINISKAKMGNKYECLLEIDKKTGKIVKEYDSIKAVTYRHAGYNYNSLKNAVGKKTAYKGYYYVWKTLEE